MSEPKRLPTDQPRLTTGTDGVNIDWPDGQQSRHLYFWLRENCHCRQCIHPDAWERMLDFLAVPLDIAPASISAAADGVHIDWPPHDAPCDGTFYSWIWLDAHRSERSARLARKKRQRAWSDNAVDKTALSVDYGDVMASDAGLLELLAHVEGKGVGFATGMPSEEGTVMALAERIAFIEESHFGPFFRVESKPNAENLAYTPHALPPHNDLSSRRHLPGIQFLHCLVNDAVGGESVLVDGVACAEALRRSDPGAFELLSTCPVVFTSIADTWHIVNRTTVIETDEDGDVRGTRCHPALMGPVDIEPDRQMAFYRAYREFLALATSDAMQFSFRLAAGECQVFDNHRMMHARRAFDPASGHRLFEGCYVCRDDLFSRLEVLRRRGADFRSR